MNRKRTIDVRKQRNLTLAQTFGLCVKGVFHRLFRSVLTLSVVTLAVAFFMFLLSENSFVKAVGGEIVKKTDEQRLAGRWLTHLFNVPSVSVLSRKLSDSWQKKSIVTLDEYVSVSTWDTNRVKRLAKSCFQEQRYMRFFDDIPLGKRVILVERRSGRKIFLFLADPQEQEVFAERIKPMTDIHLPGDMPGLTAFLNEFSWYENELIEFADVWRMALEEFAAATSKLTGGVSVEAWLYTADSRQAEAWRRLVVARGFQLDQDQTERIQAQLINTALRQEIVQKLNSAEKRKLWRKVFKSRKRISADEKMLRLNDKRVIDILDREYGIGQLEKVSSLEKFKRRLSELNRKLAGRVETGAEGSTLKGRQVFLLFISFIVCVVGIANAMLMSITERFREIATMKCLGATDRYIMIQFMLEAALHGVIGGLLGMIIGFVIALLKNVECFGSFIFINWPMHALVLNGAFSVAAGVLLSVMASLYPSWMASRMEPMEAMRIE